MDSMYTLNKVLENPRDTAENESYFAHINAVYLLAQFRIIEAYPVYIEILKLPDKLPHKLFGDSICEAGGRILASLPRYVLILENNKLH